MSLDWDRIRGNEVRHQRGSEPAPSREDYSKDDRSTRAERKPTERLLERVPTCVQELLLVGPERRRDRRRLRKEELLDVEPDDQPLPQSDDPDENDHSR